MRFKPLTSIGIINVKHYTGTALCWEHKLQLLQCLTSWYVYYIGGATSVVGMPPSTKNVSTCVE